MTGDKEVVRKGILKTVLGALALSLVAGCDKDRAARSDAPIETVSSGAPGTVITTHLLAEAPKLGFAARIPSDVVIFVSALNLKSHLSRLEPTRFYKDFRAYLDDKTPAPSAETPPTAASVMPMIGDDAFLAVGKGGEQFVGAAARMAEADSSAMISRLLSSVTPLLAQSGGDKTQGDTSGAALDSPLSIPPVLIGIRSSDPAKTLASLLPEHFRSHLAKLGKGAEMTLADGSRFTLHEGKLAALLDESAPQTGWARLLHRAKDLPFSAAWGVSGEYAIVALGAAREALDFADKPENSVLARNEWGFMADQIDESLVGLGLIDQAVLELSSSRLRPVALIQSWLHKLPPGSPLEGLSAALKEKLEALAASESRWMDQAWSPAAFGVWWQNGIRLEMLGGPVMEDEVAPQGFQFLNQLEEPSVIYGFSSQVNQAEQARFQAFLSDWGTVLQHATHHLLQQNSGAADGANAAKQWFDTEVVPSVKEMYHGLMQVTTEGMGSERAWLIELPESAMPEAQDGSNDTPGAHMPHLARLADVNERKALHRGWLAMESPLSKLVRSIPTGLPPETFVPEMVLQDGMNVYYLSLPFASPQFSPCLAVSDHSMILSSSRALCEDLTRRLQKPKKQPADSTLCHWRLNVPLLRKWMQAGSLSSHAATTSAAAHWLAPFGDLRGQSSLKGGKLRRVWTWDISDPRRFD